ncbi:hypothetical protein GW17_00053159 [Ensete ventricosum]|nr:hypothetical protein GW17_00053159 [Ensete ventricosum]
MWLFSCLYRRTHITFTFAYPRLALTLEAIKRICPKQALLIGMTHEFDHHKDNILLAEWSRREGIPVQLAHDGLLVFIDL